MKTNVKISGVLEFSFSAENENEAENLVNDAAFVERESGINSLEIEKITEANVFEGDAGIDDDYSDFTGHCVFIGSANEDELSSPTLIDWKKL